MLKYIEDEETYQFTKYLNLVKNDEKQLFEIFAYGVYDPRLKLNDKQKKKLIELTIIQLCQNNKKVPFSKIQQACEINDVEPILIEIFQKELIVGTIDDKNKCINVERCISRDVRQSDIPEMKRKIMNMYQFDQISLQKAQKIKEKLK